jgi:hypothetical protein
MFWLKKVVAPAFLFAGIAGATMLYAQDEKKPRGEGDKKGPADKGPGDKKGGPFSKGFEKRGPGEAKKEIPAKPDPIVDAWVKVLVEKIADPHDTVRESARIALVHVGRQALPALQKLADGDDSAKAVAAKKVMSAIEHHHGHHGMDGHFPGHFGEHWGFGHGGPAGMQHGWGHGGPGGHWGMGGGPGHGGPPWMEHGRGPGGPFGKGFEGKGPEGKGPRGKGPDGPPGKGGKEGSDDAPGGPEEVAPPPREESSNR